jgi:hypothetical protein
MVRHEPEWERIGEVAATAEAIGLMMEHRDEKSELRVRAEAFREVLRSYVMYLLREEE